MPLGHEEPGVDADLRGASQYPGPYCLVEQGSPLTVATADHEVGAAVAAEDRVVGGYELHPFCYLPESLIRQKVCKLQVTKNSANSFTSTSPWHGSGLQ